MSAMAEAGLPAGRVAKAPRSGHAASNSGARPGAQVANQFKMPASSAEPSGLNLKNASVREELLGFSLTNAGSFSPNLGASTEGARSESGASADKTKE